MSDAKVEIGAEGMDTDKIAKSLEEAIDRKAREGAYGEVIGKHMPGINLDDLRKGNNLLDAYIDRLREAVFVDINDFDIHERRRFLPGLFIGFKRCIWKMLKWYTYRLWSQQNQVNGLLLSLNEAMENRYADRIRELEDRVGRLEERLASAERGTRNAEL